MIDLKSIYGDEIFDSSPYRYAQHIPRLISFITEILFAWGIVNIFNVNWDFAFLKVILLIELAGILQYLVSFLWYRIFVKQFISSEMKHYLGMFNYDVNWDNISTYDDFLLEASFSKNLSCKKRVLAGMNYSALVTLLAIHPRLDNWHYNIFNDIVKDFIPKDVLRS